MPVSCCLRVCVILVGLMLLSSVAAAAPAAHATTAPTYTLTRADTPFATPSLPELRKATTPACQRAIHTAAPPTLTTTLVALDATNAPINTAAFNMPSLPYTITYQVTITNTSGTNMAKPTTIAFIFYDISVLNSQPSGKYTKFFKTTLHKVPALHAGANTIINVKHVYTSGMKSAVVVNIDPQCRQNFAHPMAKENVLRLYAPTVDLVPSQIVSLYQSGPNTIDWNTLTATDVFEMGVAVANFGQKDPTADISLRITSPLLGTVVPVTIPVAQLPKAGQEVGFLVSDSMGQPKQFTAPTVSKITLLPLSVTLTLPTGDTSKANSRTLATTSVLRPQGIDLTANGGFENCPVLVGTSQNIAILLQNYGSTDTPFGFSVQVYIDGKASGPPIPVSTIAAGGAVGIYSSAITFTKAGKHSVKIVVDPTKTITDYNPTNNIVTFSSYVLS